MPPQPSDDLRCGSGGACAALLVALYNVSLEATLPDSLDATVVAEVPHATGSAAEDLFHTFVDRLCALGVRVVACQQRMAPALIRLLMARGLLPLPRVSLRFIGAVTWL